MADRHADALLIGGGAASHACAVALRERGFSGSVLLVGRELDPPYDRPPCSKEYLRGERERPATYLSLPGDVDVLTRTSVMKLDAAARVARLSTKEEVSYGCALLATGANVRRLPVDGAQLDGVHYLRALGNADAIREDAEGLGPARREAVVVGGSYLGTELAASLTLMGKRVTVLMQEDVPLERAYGRRAGEWFQARLEREGVTFVGGESLAGFAGDDEERVTEVLTSGGRSLPARMVVVAAGAVPDVMVAKAAGLEIGPMGGVRCDASLRVIGAEGLWAAGDMCEWESPLHGGPARVEHWEVAAGHGRTAAAGMCGEPVEHAEVPYFWSDVADWVTSEYVGVVGPEGWDREALRGSFESGAFSMWYLRGERLVGALSVRRGDDLDEARRLIASGERVTPQDLERP
ncbi:NAD(P)/FAD-dependent oxidoreductase [Capillimicrobium parvum]|uniref:Rhodocoxin reductase n=1 Tax=Capillimicrobium parvum TaxID=2884022 RepID=A0A9E7C1E2_9ACTN|nr:FAD-dependent oxidoreductase [Capillimicrobium parvum]UGS37395.1 Rhodocoxin reductase [Capillimicrobium parvum]